MWRRFGCGRRRVYVSVCMCVYVCIWTHKETIADETMAVRGVDTHSFHSSLRPTRVCPSITRKHAMSTLCCPSIVAGFNGRNNNNIVSNIASMVSIALFAPHPLWSSWWWWCTPGQCPIWCFQLTFSCCHRRRPHHHHHHPHSINFSYEILNKKQKNMAGE